MTPAEHLYLLVTDEVSETVEMDEYAVTIEIAISEIEGLDWPEVLKAIEMIRSDARVELINASKHPEHYILALSLFKNATAVHSMMIELGWISSGIAAEDVNNSTLTAVERHMADLLKSNRFTALGEDMEDTDWFYNN